MRFSWRRGVGLVALMATLALRPGFSQAEARVQAPPDQPGRSAPDDKPADAKKRNRAKEVAKPREQSAERDPRDAAHADQKRDLSDDSFARREKIALAFARAHHRQLADLLARMKRQENRDEYKDAIGDLYETSERLSRIERDAERHGLMLELWKLDSRTRLLAARMSMSSSSTHEQDLQDALRKRVDLQLQLYRLERDRAAARVSRLENSIEEIVKDPEAAAQKSLERLKRSLDARPSQRAANKARPKSAVRADEAVDTSDP